MWPAEGRQADRDPPTNSRMVAGQGGLYESRSVGKMVEIIKNRYDLSRKNCVRSEWTSCQAVLKDFHSGSSSCSDA